MGRVMTLAQAATMARATQLDGRVVVTTNGCFDLLHYGHAWFLAQCRQMGDVLVVGVNSDASAAGFKRLPVIPEEQRALLVAALGCVDAVVVFSEPTPVEFVRAVRPTVHVKGDDRDLETMPETTVVRAAGGRVVAVQRLNGLSTTGILERLRATA